MIRPILRKDLALLWPLVATVTALEIITTVLLGTPGPLQRASLEFGDGGDFAWISNVLLPLACLVGFVALVLAVIHQDRFPGTDQDWLVRPIARRTLVLAKVTFIGLAGLMPIFACDVAAGVFAHVPIGAAIGASAARSLLLFGIVVLPTALLGVVTRSLAEALVLAILALVVIALCMPVVAQLKISPFLVGTSYAWISEVVLAVTYAVLAPLIIGLQFAWRSTARLRWIVVAMLAASPLVLFLPPRVALIVHELAERSGPVTFLSLAPNPARPGRIAWRENWGKALDVDPMARIVIPLSVSLATGSDAWRIDHQTIRIVSPDGATLYRPIYDRLGSRASAVIEGPDDDDAEATAYLPEESVRVAIARHARVEITLWLTSFERGFRSPLASLDGQALDAASRCNGITVHGEPMTRCISTRPVSACQYIADAAGRRVDRSWPGDNCRRFSYAPLPLSFWRDPYYTALIRIPFGDDVSRERARGLERSIVNFVPRAHAVRVVVVPIDTLRQEVDRRVVYSRDGKGEAARFSAPSAPVADRQGMFYLVDTDENVLRRITPEGEVTTLAGVAGECGRTDGLGRAARFCHPIGLAIDPAGMLYVVDAGNYLIRKVTPGGEVTTSMRLADPTTLPYGDDWTRAGLVTRTPDGSIFVVGHSHPNTAFIVRIAPDGSVTKVAGSGELPDDRPDERPTGE